MRQYEKKMQYMIFLATIVETFFVLFLWPFPLDPVGLPPYFAAVSAAIFGITRWCSFERETCELTARMWLLAYACALVGWFRCPSTRVGHVMFGARSFVHIVAFMFARREWKHRGPQPQEEWPHTD